MSQDFVLDHCLEIQIYKGMVLLVTSGSVLVVKTHKPSFYATKSGNSSNIFQQAVYIIRNPIITKRNLQLSNDYSSRHVNAAEIKAFGELINYIWYINYYY